MPGRQPGQSLVEFAFVAFFVLAPLLVIVLDFSQVFYYDIMVSAAANAGVRAAANGASDTDVQNAAVYSAPSGRITAANVTVTPPHTTTSPRTAGLDPLGTDQTKNYDWTTVTVTSTVNLLTPLTQLLAGSSSMTVTGRASQRMRLGCCQ
jgi:Flp pilus assembly protein TadG